MRRLIGFSEIGKVRNLNQRAKTTYSNLFSFLPSFLSRFSFLLPPLISFLSFLLHPQLARLTPFSSHHFKTLGTKNKGAQKKKKKKKKLGVEGEGIKKKYLNIKKNSARGVRASGSTIKLDIYTPILLKSDLALWCRVLCIHPPDKIWLLPVRGGVGMCVREMWCSVNGIRKRVCLVWRGPG